MNSMVAQVHIEKNQMIFDPNNLRMANIDNKFYCKEENVNQKMFI